MPLSEHTEAAWLCVCARYGRVCLITNSNNNNDDSRSLETTPTGVDNFTQQGVIN